jgi:hypothetical protein
MSPSTPIDCAQIYNFRPKSNENTYSSPESHGKITRQFNLKVIGSDEKIARPLSSSNIKSYESSVESVEHLPFQMD